MSDLDQNSIKNRRLVISQDTNYTKAKIFSTFQIIFAVISVILTFWAINVPIFKAKITIISFIMLLIDFFVLQKYIKKYRELGAKTQEKFDCGMLNIPFNSLKMGEMPKEEEILEISKKSKNNDHLKDWYYEKILVLDSPFKELLIIRSNLYWDSFLKTRYMHTVSILFLIIMVAAFGYAISENNTIVESIALIIAPLSPFIALNFKLIFENQEAIKKLNKLYDHVIKLISDGKKGKKDFQQELRNLQDEIFEGRKRNLLTPTIFQKIYKKSLEETLYTILDEEIEDITKNKTSVIDK